MKGDVFTIKVMDGKNIGRYRVIADGLPQALDRANTSFKNEFGVYGKPQQEMEQNENNDKKGKNAQGRKP